MTANRPSAARSGNRRGNAVILVMLLTFALAALAGSAVMLSSGATNIEKFHEANADLRYDADAALALGVSDLSNSPYLLPTTGYIQMENNATLQTADSSQIRGVTYSMWAGQTGSASAQLGRFVTVLVQVNDTAHHRSYVRREELNEETFAKFAYFSEQENGICFGSGDRLTGPIFSDDNIQSCSGQKAEFMDSVETHLSFTNGNPSIDTLYKPPARQGLPAINLPSTSALATLFTRAQQGNAVFGTGYTSNANTDSTSKVKQRLEFVAYRMNPTDPDSTVPGSGFVRYYAVGKTNPWWTNAAGGNYGSAASVDSAQSVYLRAGNLHRASFLNCGDWHYVKINGTGPYEWEFFPAYAHSFSWFQPLLDATDHEKSTVFPAANTNATTGWRSANGINRLTYIFKWGNDSTNLTAAAAAAGYTAATIPNPMCVAGGDPHLSPVERMGATQTGSGGSWPVAQWQRGGTDTTFTPTGTLGSWAPYSGAAPSYPTAWAASHAYVKAYLTPIDTVYNPNFQGVIAVYGTMAISGNVNGHVSVYTDGSASLIDNLRLTTSEADTSCLHGMGLVVGSYILPADNGINMEQHLDNDNYASLRQVLGGPISNDLYVQATVMALKSWGVEQLSYDSIYNVAATADYGMGGGTSGGPAGCNGSYYIRGCVWVYGSIIQNGRVTVNGCGSSVTGIPSAGYNSNWGCGYAKQYAYDQCAAVNPLPFFPTTGRFVVNKFYEVDPITFNPASLFAELAPPP